MPSVSILLCSALLWEIPPGSLPLALYLQLWLWPSNVWRVATEEMVLSGKSNSSVVLAQALQSVDVGTRGEGTPASKLS